MTDEQIIQLAEYFGVNMRTNERVLSDNGDGTISFNHQATLHYSGRRIIELIKFLEVSPK